MIAIYGFLASDPDANHLWIFKLRATPWLHVIYHVWLSVTDSGGYKYLLDTMRTKHVQQSRQGTSTHDCFWCRAWNVPMHPCHWPSQHGVPSLHRTTQQCIVFWQTAVKSMQTLHRTSILSNHCLLVIWILKERHATSHITYQFHHAISQLRRHILVPKWKNITYQFLHTTTSSNMKKLRTYYKDNNTPT